MSWVPTGTARGGPEWEDWRLQIGADPTAATTLFLLDLCHAGAANRHWQPPQGRTEERAWVIAAAGADQPAYAGRLTRAAAAVIEEITCGRADLDPTLRWRAWPVSCAGSPAPCAVSPASQRPPGCSGGQVPDPHRAVDESAGGDWTGRSSSNGRPVVISGSGDKTGQVSG